MLCDQTILPLITLKRSPQHCIGLVERGRRENLGISWVIWALTADQLIGWVNWVDDVEIVGKMGNWAARLNEVDGRLI